jgi:hypothetical protein
VIPIEEMNAESLFARNELQKTVNRNSR